MIIIENDRPRMRGRLGGLDERRVQDKYLVEESE